MHFWLAGYIRAPPWLMEDFTCSQKQTVSRLPSLQSRIFSLLAAVFVSFLFGLLTFHRLNSYKLYERGGWILNQNEKRALFLLHGAPRAILSIVIATHFFICCAWTFHIRLLAAECSVLFLNHVDGCGVTEWKSRELKVLNSSDKSLFLLIKAIYLQNKPGLSLKMKSSDSVCLLSSLSMLLLCGGCACFQQTLQNALRFAPGG